MAKLPAIDSDFLLGFLIELLNTPSPTGFTHQAMEQVARHLESYPQLETTYSRKGALVANWPGQSDEHPRALTAHVDTLGAMVKEIKSNGRLQLTNIGSYAWNTIEGEGCTVFTTGGKWLRGAILLEQASGHIHGKDVNELKRSSENLEVRLDARTLSTAETRQLGIEVGDFVALDPRVEINQGFIRSRHLDDKAGVACILTALKALHSANLAPVQRVTLHFSNYEEVGHGASAGLPDDLTELVTVDMAPVGKGQQSDEFHATLCAKDSGGPYHHGLSQRLRRLAVEYDIPWKIDTYPYYGSDGEAYWRSGGDVAVALIGPGVDASHNYERTHIEALEATTNWLCAYLLNK